LYVSMLKAYHAMLKAYHAMYLGSALNRHAQQVSTSSVSVSECSLKGTKRR